MISTSSYKPDPNGSNEEWKKANFSLPGSDADYRVAAIEVVDDRTLHVSHRDETQGYVRFKPSAFRGVFVPLANPSFFKQAYVKHGAVVWSDDIDLAPDNMHRHLFAFGEWVLQ